MKRVLLYSVVFLILPLASRAHFDRDLFSPMYNDPDATELQKFLRDQGVYSGPVTGNFLSLTREGVKQFQQREGIFPVAGYFGPKTRTRVHEILEGESTSPVSPETPFSDSSGVSAPFASQDDQIALLLAQIAAIQEQILALQGDVPSGGGDALVSDDEDEDLVATSTAPVDVPIETVDTTPPAFVTPPFVKQTSFLSENFPFGPEFVYQVVLEWAGDETTITEDASCSPDLKSMVIDGVTAYFPKDNTDYTCTITLTDENGNQGSDLVAFSAPSWVGAEGRTDGPFPLVATSPLKLGDMVLYNGTNHEVQFARFRVDVTDEMDSFRNRARKVYFIVRDGPDSSDTLVSKTAFTFVLAPPKVGKPHKSRIDLGNTVLLAAGEKRTMSLWVERLEYVRSGTFQVKSVDITITNPDDLYGSFDFVLTQEPAA